ncbi:MAG TPA: cytochrome c [Verrucomicrobiae bacterium]|nr:cytochrome c [Verrucomicrobiae bacterium]
MSDDPKNISMTQQSKAGESRTVPIWILALTLVLLFLGGVYFDRHSGWFDSQVYAPYQNLEEVDLYQPKSGEAAMLAHGKQLYEQVCGTCHSPDGAGKPGQAPPLAGSEWVNAKGPDRVITIPLEGLSGEVHVKGETWNASMAAMGIGLSDPDLAAVLTYIRTSWGNKGEAVTADDVKAIRAKVAGHPPVNGETQLKAIPE